MPPVEAARIADVEELGDAALASRAGRGDSAAFRVIMQRHNRRLYRVARGILKDDPEAEDVVQEAYVRAFSALSEFRGDSSLVTWLTRITVNEALGRLRRRRPAVELEALDSLPVEDMGRVIPFRPADSDPERATAQREIRRLLERAIDQLPEPFRVVFVMRAVEEMSIEETAAHLGLKPETVKTRLHRARRLLRQALDAELSSVLADAFPFEGARCARIVGAVLRRLGLPITPA